METARADRYALAKLALVIASLTLNVWGNVWGAPVAWHPDEITGHAIQMVKTADPNPHYFAYGGLHYYVVAGLAVAPITAGWRLATGDSADTMKGRSGEQTTLVWMMVAARTISALMTAALVAITIEIGTRMFSPSAGLAAGLMLLVAPGTVLNAHYATVDAAANFWYWLTCLGALCIWKTGARRAYLFAGIMAGLAIGTKLDRVLVVVPLVVAHRLRGSARRRRDLLGALGLVPLAFVASNPALILAPWEFLDAFTRDLMFNALREVKQPALQFAVWLQWGLGSPLLILMVAGIGLGTFLLLRERRWGELVWIASTAVPVVVLYSYALSFDRYVTVMFPGLALLAGYAVARMLIEGPHWRRLLAGAPITVALVWSLAACLAVDLVLLRDPRYAAAEWLDGNAPPGSRVAMDERGPPLEPARYDISLLSTDAAIHEGHAAAVERLRECVPCRWVRSVIFESERRFAAAAGRSSNRKPYTAWYDVWADRVVAEAASPPDLPDADYVLLLPSTKPVTAKRLAATGSGYQLVASFPAPRPLGITLPFLFIAVPVEIYARHAR